MNQPKEPLAWRLRNAAIERTRTDSERVDDFVLEEDGVIDLRALEIDRERAGASVADPAPVLATMRGKFGDAAEVADLYDTSEDPGPRWRLGLRARHAFDATGRRATPPADTTARADTTPATKPGTTVPREPTPPRRSAALPPLSRIEIVPLSSELPDHADAAAQPTTPTHRPVDDAVDPEIDLRDEDRPTAECPQCAGQGRRDLFDRFSQVEFYSCDHCLHMWQQDFRG